MLNNKTKVLQYIYIYMMIQASGGRVQAALGNQVFYALAFAMCSGYFLLKFKYIQNKRRWFFLWMIMITASLMVSVLMTFGGLSIITSISYLTRFILVFVAIDMDKEAFTHRFLKLTLLLCVASLITFIPTQIFGQQALEPIYNNLYYIPNENKHLGGTYGLFFIVFNFMDPTENAYMFGEPGEYQMLVIVALYILVFKYKEYMNKRKYQQYLFMFVFTLLTIKSTTGLMNMFALFMAYLIAENKKLKRSSKYFLVMLSILAVVIGIKYGGTSGYLYDTFVQKFTSSNSTGIDFSEGTGAGRWGGIMRFFKAVNEKPSDVVFGVGYDGISKTAMKAFSAVGLANSIMMFGVFTNVIVFGGLFRKVKQYSKSSIETVAVIFIIINMGCGQPEVLCTMVILMALYSYLVKSSIGMRENFNEQIQKY